MSPLEIQETILSGVLLITPRIFGDSRGFFYESFNIKNYKNTGINKSFVQDNVSRSHQNTIRGLHYQGTYPQAKLVSVIRGKVYDVVVDIRPDSATYGQWIGKVLSDENHLQIYIPEGFAHGFCVLSETADFLYKCTEYYHPEDEKGIRFDSPGLNIDWGISLKDAIVSEKDRAHPVF